MASLSHEDKCVKGTVVLTHQCVIKGPSPQHASTRTLNLTTEENHKIFKEVNADKITQIRANLIKEALNDYNLTIQRLAKYQGLIYFANNGEKEFTNSPNKDKAYFKSYPSYMIFEGIEQEVFPQEIKENPKLYWVTSNSNQLGQQDIMYLLLQSSI